MIAYSAVIGAVINVIGSFSYIRDTLAGRTKPNRVTFLFWATSGLTAAAAAFAQGARWEVLPVLFTGLIPLTTLLASFFNRNAYWQLKRFDYLCGFFALLALVLWRVTDEPNIAILFAIIADGTAMAPTLRKSWTHPETETAMAYLAAPLSQVPVFIVASHPSFAAYAFPIYIILSCGLIWGVLHYRRYVLAKN